MQCACDEEAKSLPDSVESRYARLTSEALIPLRIHRLTFHLRGPHSFG